MTSACLAKNVEPVFHDYGEDARPLDQLPAQVHTQPDTVTIFADFDRIVARADRESDIVPLYVVNRSAESMPLSLQDWHAHFYLEVKVDEQWQRAETHYFASCGNSHHGVTVEPNTFVLLRGFIPRGGKKTAEARFHRKYHEPTRLVSNIAQVTFSDAELKRTKRDPLAIRYELDADTLIKLLQGELQPTTDGWGTQPWGVGGALGLRFPLCALELLAEWDADTLAAHGEEVIGSVITGITRSPEADADLLSTLATQGGGLASEELDDELAYHAANQLGSRFPVQAQQWAQAYQARPDHNPNRVRGLLGGFSQAKGVADEQLLWCLDMQIRSRTGTGAAYTLYRRDPIQAWAMRADLREKYGEDADPSIAAIEQTSLYDADVATLTEILSGERALLALPREEALRLAVRDLIGHDPNLAQALAEQWRDDDELMKSEAAAELAAKLEVMAARNH